MNRVLADHPDHSARPTQCDPPRPSSLPLKGDDAWVSTSWVQVIEVMTVTGPD